MASDRAPAEPPLTDDEFARAMAPLGPFEAAPRLAAGVSGGPDSMALALLAAAWAESRGGSLVALTVDHGLRPESAAEARAVGHWLGKRGIGHRILRLAPEGRSGARPRGGIQAAARAMRFALLAGWCEDNAVLHLLLAHDRDDQAETLLLRLARGSGVYGLAAMAPVLEGGAVRLLRPLLGFSRRRLEASLRARGQEWIEDPSNQDLRFARVRLRVARAALAREGLSVARLAATAGRMARARAALEEAVAALLAGAASLFPAGFCRLDAAPFAGVAEEVGLRALGRALAVVGGAEHGPRLERLERLYAALALAKGGAGAARRAHTLGGCRILWPGGGGRSLLVCREPARASERLALIPGRAVHWDGRFRLRLRPGRPGEGLFVARLGAGGWAAILRHEPGLRRSPVPAAARPALPALWDGRGPVLVPHLGYARPGDGRGPAEAVSLGALEVAFAPRLPMTGPSFAVAK
ncbi:MAG: tRNA lysidine(34) synthetase TilS [Proteobacteria bacterium]|nr:tRNA lysidine(34) synthetase TilS [Pseudomonadota bacterium]